MPSVAAAPDLLERDGELSVLDERLSSARRGRGTLAAIEGPAGIGKTRLLEAAIETAAGAGMAVLRATGSELEADFAFGVARQLFELPLAELSSRERGRLLAGVAGRAPVVLGVEHGPDRPAAPESAFAASHALFWLTANLASRSPILVAVDDVHWADVASLRYLHFLARRVADLPVALVVAVRPAAARNLEPELCSLLEQAGTPLRPSPLSAGAVAVLVRSRLGSEGDPRFVEACEQTTDGNVFLLTELLRSLHVAGVEPTAEAVGEVRSVAPDAVRRRVATQLAVLPPSASALACAVAVLGEASLPRAAAIAGVDIERARLDARELERATLFAVERPLRFRHPVIAAVVAAGIEPGELADAHARAAHLLAGEGSSPDAVAAHLLRAEPAGDLAAVAALRRAAAAAFDRGAPEAAVSYLRRALAEPPEAAARAEVLLELGKAEISARMFAEAAQTLRLGLAAAGNGGSGAGAGAGVDPGTDAALVVALSQAFDLAGDYESAIGVLDQARRRRSGASAADCAMIDHHLVTLAMLEPRRRAGADALIRAWQHAALDDTLEDPVARAIACTVAVAAGLPSSQWLPILRTAVQDPWLRPYESAVDLNSWAHNMAAMALEWSDGLEEAEAELSSDLAESRRRGDAPQAAMVITCLARVTFRLGRVADAERYGRLGEELGTGIASSAAFPFTLFDVLAEQGRYEEADRLLERVPTSGAPQNIAVVGLMRGRVGLAAGRHREALEDLLRAGEVLESLEFRHPNFVPWRSHAVAAALGCGKSELARRYAGEDLAIARHCEAGSAIGRALRNAALVAALVEDDPARARKLLEESCAVLAASPARLDEAYSVVELGASLRAEGDPAAREQLRRGLDLAHRCGATLLAERARRELVAAGGRPRRSVISGVDALTHSEREVARLAAGGMTNREIAQALFVTLKTVEQHLGKTYQKLSISGRRALAAALEASEPAGLGGDGATRHGAPHTPLPGERAAPGDPSPLLR